MSSHQTSTPPSASTAPQAQPGIPTLRLNITKPQIRAVHAKYKALKEQGVPNTDPQMMHAKSILSHVKRFREWRRKQHTKASEPNASSEPTEDPNQAPHVSTQIPEELTATGGPSSPAEPGAAPNVQLTAATPPPLTPQQQAEANRKLSARHLAHAWKFSILAGEIAQAEEVAILAGKLNMMEEFHGEATRLAKGDHGLRARVRNAKVRGERGEGIGTNTHDGGGVARLPTASAATEESSDEQDAEALKAKRQRLG
ncbi:hypothetical protein KC340_g11381 [Hortaea werneckii]|nr:hypothetical protein KC342_g11654 [Hortaea werneckii]KAI7082530.1 hypothetical protein KC339_g13186 [Hortaea werneckii]KAI7234414.1 hypothetical protein KC365_g5977 [Hortaea werneckii]KAI7307474.1 hypothetical protein KC340_g11381 [Hortaea werneckii]KAI7393218.1 hypothetical protein KC328_g6710 [Hortaea werneckii]